MADFTNPTQDNFAEASLLPDEWCGYLITPPGPNNRWEIDICDIPGSAGGVVFISPSMDEAAINGFIDQYIEADMALDVGPWSSIAEMQSIARHEFGHWYGLGDLYQMWPGTCAANEAAQGPPVMCTTASGVQIGNVNGLYYLYPELNTFDFPDSFVNNNIDAAVYQIAGSANNNADMVVLITDRDSGTNTNHFKIRPLVDIDPNTYAGTLGVTETLFSVTSGTIRDVGIAISNVDNSGTDNRDMVVGYVDTLGRIKFRTYFDINLSSNNLGWTSVSAEQTIVPSTTNHYGIDMVVFNVDGDTRDEMVIFSTEIVNSVRYVHWWVVNFNNDGTIASTTAFTSNTIRIEHNEIGAGVVDVANRKITVSMNAEDITSDEYVAIKC